MKSNFLRLSGLFIGIVLGLLPFSFAYADTSASIQSISPGTTVQSGQQVSFVVQENGFVNPVYTLSDSFSGSTVTINDLNGSVFYWTPQVSDAGVHTIVVAVTDSQGDSATTSAQITVGAVPTVSVANLSGATFPMNAPVSLTVVAQGFSSPTYSLSDSYQGSTLNSGDISSSGLLVWTPQAQDVGPHTVTLYANDASSHSASVTYNFTVSSSVVTTTATTTSYAASGLTPTQASAIISLLQSFGVDQGTINTVSAILNGGSAATTPSTTTSTTPAYTFTEYLAPGSQDNEVLMLQDLLQQQGLLTATPNGYFGDATEAAVLAFQAAHGIDQLGVVGPSTRAALNAIEGDTSGASTSSTTKVGDGYVFQNPINPGDSDNDVTELQTRLTALGVYSGPITGYYGDLTTAAVTQFQSNNGISAVGYVGPATMAALNSQ